MRWAFVNGYQERSTDPSDFDDVLQHLEDAERPGRPPKGSKDEEPQELGLEDLKSKTEEAGLVGGDFMDFHNVGGDGGDKGLVRIE